MSEFESKRVAVLRQIRIIVVQIRSMWPTVCTEFIELYSSFLTI